MFWAYDSGGPASSAARANTASSSAASFSILAQGRPLEPGPWQAMRRRNLASGPDGPSAGASLPRHALAFLARLGQADRDGLLAALHLAGPAAAAALGRAALVAAHLAFDFLACAAGVFP